MGLNKVTATPEPTTTVKRSTPEGKPVEPASEELIAPSEPRKMFAADEYTAFLMEPVQVIIAPAVDSGDSTRLVTFGVNGKRFSFIRGRWYKVPRFVIEALATTKKEAWEFSYTKAPDGTTIQHDNAMQHLAYQFTVKDENPKGAAWLQWLLERNL